MLMIFRKFRSLFSLICHRVLKLKFISSQSYWNYRTRQFGYRAVYNLSHDEEERSKWDSYLTELYEPILRKAQFPPTADVLDFGCGWGRFSHFLKKVFNGKIYGVDLSKEMIDLARTQNSFAEYELFDNKKIYLPNKSVDVIFVHLVLGGIPDRILPIVLKELKRIAKDNALFFIVENTSKKKDLSYWHYHSVEYYQQLFDFVDLQYIDAYQDADDTDSIFMGYKK